MLEQRCSLIEAADGLKGGMFVYIKGYCKNEIRKIDGVEKVVYSQKSNVTLNADISYENTHQRSAEQLDIIEKNKALSFNITRNAWVDEQGVEYNRKKQGRKLVEGIKEVITIKDKDFADAVAKVRKSIIDPRKVTDNMEKIAKSTYDNAVTGRTYFRNVFVNNKVSIDEQGKYPISCSKRVNVIADTIRNMLPVGKYRTYILDDEVVEMVDGTHLPRFEYIALMSESISSSSSSEEVKN